MSDTLVTIRRQIVASLTAGAAMASLQLPMAKNGITEIVVQVTGAMSPNGARVWIQPEGSPEMQNLSQLYGFGVRLNPCGVERERFDCRGGPKLVLFYARDEANDADVTLNIIMNTLAEPCGAVQPCECC